LSHKVRILNTSFVDDVANLRARRLAKSHNYSNRSLHEFGAAAGGIASPNAASVQSMND
jgi:hypothetical protein